MKKVLSLIIALCLLCSIVQMPSYATDTEESNEAAETLEALGIMEGSGGDLMLEKVLTRAEFVTMLIRVLGAEYENPTVYFDDVGADHWAVSSVATACEMGIVNGIDEKHFAPDTPVLYEEAVKMLVTALGYEVWATKKGGYPTGYIAVAQSVDLLDDVKGTVGLILRRHAAAQLIYNALETEIVVETGINTNGEIDAATQEGVTLLSEKMKIYKGEGIVSADEITTLSSAGGLSEGQVKIGNRIFSAGKTGAEKYLGYTVTYYADASENEDVQKLLYVRINEKKNDVITVMSEDINLDATTISCLSYTDEDGDSRKAEISLIADLLYNGVGTGGFRKEDLKPQNGYVTLIDNNLDNKADVVLVYDFQTIVTETVSLDAFRAYDKFDNIKYVELDPKDEDYRCVIYEDGVEKQFTAIKKDSVLLVATSKNASGDKKITVLISNNSFTGEITAIGDTTVFVNDLEYEVTSSVKSVLAPYLGKETIVYIDALGRLAGVEEDVQAGFVYGYLIAHAPEKGISGKYIFKMLTEESMVSLLYGAKKISVDGAASVKPAEAAAAIDNAKSANGIGNGQLVRYKVNSKNEITAIDTVASDKGGDGDALSKDIDKYSVVSSMRKYMNQIFGKRIKKGTIEGDDENDVADVIYADFSVDENTLVFLIPEDAYLGDDMQYSVSGMEYFNNSSYYDLMEAYDLTPLRCANVCLLQKPSLSQTQVPTSALLSVVEKIRVTTNPQGEETYSITFWQNAKKITLLTKNQSVLTNSDTGNLYKPGDLVRYVVNSENEIEKIDALISGAADTQTELGKYGVGSNKYTFFSTIGAFFGYMTHKDGDKVLIDTDLTTTDEGIGATEKNTEFPCIIPSTAQYIMYDVSAKEVIDCTQDTLMEHTYDQNSASRIAVCTKNGVPNVVVIYKFD